MSVLGMDLVGHDLDGELDGELEGDVLGFETVGARRRHHRRHHHRYNPYALQRPDWRSQELAPGVNMPQEGMIPLPMSPLSNGGTFTASVTNITYQGQLQVPFRSERLLATTSRVGTSAVAPRCLGQFFVGVGLQQADIQGIDVEAVGAPTAFGVRMTMVQAPPGVLVRVPVVLSIGLTDTDTIFLSMTFMGRVVH